MQKEIDHATNTTTRDAGDHSSRCTVTHPEYRFLAFDDMVRPTRMTISLTSTRFESDVEDKRRLRLAQEIEWALTERGVSLEVTVMRERLMPTLGA